LRARVVVAQPGDRREVAAQCGGVDLLDAAGVVLGQFGQVAAVRAQGVRGLAGEGQVGEEVAHRAGQLVLAGQLDPRWTHRDRPACRRAGRRARRAGRRAGPQARRTGRAARRRRRRA
jgi:hypothetical protein